MADPRSRWLPSRAAPRLTTGSAVVLTVAAPPAITHLQFSSRAFEGAFAYFIAEAAGSPLPAYYQWRRNGTNLADGAKWSGPLTDTLVVLNLESSDAGNYSVQV